MQSAWISIFTPAVWDDPVRDKTRRAFPSTRPARVMAGHIKEGDLIIELYERVQMHCRCSCSDDAKLKRD